MNDNELSRHPSEVLACFQTQPKWILSSGISTISIVILALLLIAAWLPYPSHINGEVSVISDPPPIDIKPQSTNRIARLLVSDNDRVSRGDWLVIHGSTESPELVKKLIAKLSLHGNSSCTMWSENTAKEKSSGQLSRYFDALVNACNELKNYYQGGLTEQKITSLYSKHLKYKKYVETLLKQKETLSLNLSLARERLDAVKNSDNRQFIDERTLSDLTSEWLGRRRSIESVETNIAKVSIDLVSLVGKIELLKLEQKEEEEGFLLAYRTAESALMTAIEEWKNSNVIVSPIDGNVRFLVPLYDNKIIDDYRPLMNVTPIDESQISGWAFVDKNNISEAKISDKALVHLNAFDSNRYGVLEGRVVSISEVPLDDKYFLKIAFDNGLKTNIGKSIALKQKMDGRVEIIGNPQTLLERLLGNLLLSNRF